MLEGADRAGSKMAVKRRDGFLLDTGAIFLPSTYRNLLEIAAQVGLADSLTEGGFTFGLVRDAEIHHLDGTRPVRAFARLGALSGRAKLRSARLAPGSPPRSGLPKPVASTPRRSPRGPTVRSLPRSVTT